ncbi:MAG: hypothetical protein ACRC68_02390 [Clostridium sp.]
MEILLIIFVFLGLTSVFAMIALFYNGGKYLRNKFILTLLTLHILTLSFITYTGLASNYIFQKIFCGIFIVSGCLGFVLNYAKKDSSLISRLMIAVSILGNIIILFI